MAVMDIFIKTAKDDGKCVIVSTHSQEAAARADEVFYL